MVAQDAAQDAVCYEHSRDHRTNLGVVLSHSIRISRNWISGILVGDCGARGCRPPGDPGTRDPASRQPCGLPRDAQGKPGLRARSAHVAALFRYPRIAGCIAGRDRSNNG